MNNMNSNNGKAQKNQWLPVLSPPTVSQSSANSNTSNTSNTGNQWLPLLSTGDVTQPNATSTTSQSAETTKESEAWDDSSSESK